MTTKKTSGEFGCAWCFTSFLIDENTQELKTPLVPTVRNFQYLVYGFEICPETGRPHFQGYVEFKKSIIRKDVQRLLGLQNVHFNPRNGEQMNAIQYCKKGEQSHEEWDKEKWDGPNFGLNAIVVEEGTPKEDNQGERRDMARIKDRIMSGVNIRTVVMENVANYQQLKYAEGLAKYIKPPKRDDIECFWFWGPTGTGKTRTVHELEDDLYGAQDDLKWWDGYFGQEAVIVDDFRGQCPLNYLLKVLDRYPMKTQVKSAMTNLEMKRIYITSCKPPEEVYKNCGENIDQLVRRFKEIRYFGPTKTEVLMSKL